MQDTGLQRLFLSLALAIMVGWIFHIGRPILVPVAISLIAVYVLSAATEAVSRFPGFSALPTLVLRLVVLAIFTLILFAFALVVVVTVRALIENAPQYEVRIENMVVQVADLAGIETHPTWDDVRRVTLEQFDIQSFLIALLGSISSIGAMIFIIVVYAAFLMAERGRFESKIHAAFPKGHRADRTIEVLRSINERVGDYLAIKTLINIILGAISYVILFLMDVDFALFWALVIALLNYIPYVGSLMGVIFPVILSVAQYGDLRFTILLAVLLTGAQMYVGNIVEPRLVGKQLNLSPFVVLLALSVWSTIWGLPGAILAVPMTSVLVIIFSSFDETRFIAVLLAQRTPEEDEVATSK